MRTIETSIIPWQYQQYVLGHYDDETETHQLHLIFLQQILNSDVIYRGSCAYS